VLPCLRAVFEPQGFPSSWLQFRGEILLHLLKDNTRIRLEDCYSAINGEDATFHRFEGDADKGQLSSLKDGAKRSLQRVSKHCGP